MGKLWTILNIPRSLPAVYMYRKLPCANEIRDDLKRLGFGTGWVDFHSAMLTNTLFRKCVYFRTAAQAPWLTRLSKLLLRPAQGFELEAEQIGGGIMIYHGYSSVVFAKSIGKNFTVYQQVTVGRGKERDGTDIPIIGDDVTVYAGAIIVGGVRIGNHATIGAGAVVTQDVPDNAVVVGAPVRIIRK